MALWSIHRQLEKQIQIQTPRFAMAPRTVPAQRWETEGKTRRAAVRRKVGYEFCNKSSKICFLFRRKVWYEFRNTIYLFLSRKWDWFWYFSTFVEKQFSWCLLVLGEARTCRWILLVVSGNLFSNIVLCLQLQREIPVFPSSSFPTTRRTTRSLLGSPSSAARWLGRMM